MPDLRFWLHFVTAFTIVIAILMIGAGVHSWWDWKKEQMTAEDRMRSALKIFVLAAVVVIVLMAGLIAALAHDEDHDHDAWYGSLMQPDNPSVSCCGLADAYWCDDYFARDGKAYCKITDDRDDVPLKRPHIDIGTEFEIPPYKLKWDRANPTGHSVVFVNTSGHVWCFVQAGGV